MKKAKSLFLVALLILTLLAGCTNTEPISETPINLTATESAESFEQAQKSVSPDNSPESDIQQTTTSIMPFKLSSIPDYNGSPYVAVNGNNPYFTESDYTTVAFENYSQLDSKGRCGVAFANICLDIMPTEERGNIGSVKPSGWHTVKYEIVDGKYLYNRCHLIGFQLAGENDNKLNLITGTRYFNVTGMLPFENMIDDYVDETNNHVIYRVTPMYEGDNLVASGVLMEAWSVEDDGEGVCFCVYVPNVQPGVIIDYATGESRAE